MRQILLPLALAAATQAQLVTFAAGSPAKAADVNGNFAYLASRLDSLTKAIASKDSAAQRSQVRQDSLVKALQSKDTAIAALKNAPSWSDSLIKIGKRLDAGIPKGTIAGFLTAPGIDGYLPNSDQTWILAAGQTGVNGLDLPELRGVFLRGGEIDFNIAGGTMGYSQRDTLRTPGNFQDDAFQGHWHKLLGSGTPMPGHAGVGAANEEYFPLWAQAVVEPIADSTNGPPRTAKETRPKNVAVYWYIKVK